VSSFLSDCFGEVFIRQVRDRTITEWEKIIDGRMKGVTAKKVRDEINVANSEVSKILIRMVPRIVDTAIHNVLWSLEQEQSVNLFVEKDGEGPANIRDESDGLAGELYGENGWIARFSQKWHEES